VTKYWNADETQEIVSQFDEVDILIGLWENRVSSLKEKGLDREATHFIGNIQTKEIKFITQYCSTIHSLCKKKQLRKMDAICQKQWNWIKVFVQIQLDQEKSSGITPEEIPEFMEAIDECENISLIGFSGIWKSECSVQERRAEFRLLKELRSKYLQNGFVSAGTSRDYEIAIEEEIDIIRVGTKLII
jgi:uncharacterized pyridoxal phosphate-containing UPF0001 family protein